MTWPPHARCFQTRAASCLEIQQGRSLGAHGLMAHPTNGPSLPCHDLYIYICICASVCCFNAKAPWKRMCPQKIIRSISSIIIYIYIFPYTALHMLMLPHRPVWCFCSGGLHRDHSRCQSCLGRCLSRRAGGAAMRADLQSGFCKGEQIRTLDRPVV